MEVTNNPKLKFSSLDDELYRIYTFESGAQVKIDAPSQLNVSKAGGHRILDGEGVSHYIPSGWIHLSWKVKEGHPAFAF